MTGAVWWVTGVTLGRGRYSRPKTALLSILILRRAQPRATRMPMECMMSCLIRSAARSSSMPISTADDSVLARTQYRMRSYTSEGALLSKIQRLTPLLLRTGSTSIPMYPSHGERVPAEVGDRFCVLLCDIPDLLGFLYR